MVANTLLSLSALLLLAGARAHCEGGRRPKMTAAGATVREIHPSTYIAQYGGNVRLFCSFHDSGYLTIRRYEYIRIKENLPIVMLNATTVSSLTELTLGVYTYICADSRSGCESDHLNIYLNPAMHVSSPHAIFQMGVSTDTYFLPHGDRFQVICTGPEYETLHIYSSDPYIEVNTDVVNDTSVAYSARADRTGEFLYWCRTRVVNTGFICGMRLVVDYIPEAYNFSCVYVEKQFDCSWSPSSARTTFKMFYSDKIVCISITGENNNGGCVWKNSFHGSVLVKLDSSVFSVILETCNQFICNNQTFTMHFRSIVKPNPIIFSYVKSTSARDAVMSWQNSCYSDNPCSTKVEYRLVALGEPWRQADTSSVRCDGGGGCDVWLAPLYPDSKYKVRVYHRYKEATDDRLWSDPDFSYVVTKPRDECACEASKGTSEAITRDAACEACLLADHIYKKISARNELKIKLKQKRYRINGYIKRIKVLEAIDSFPLADSSWEGPV